MARRKPLPKSFQLLNHTITIKDQPGLIEEHGAYGLWSEKDLTIWIDSSTPPSFVKHTLWHEVMHAVLDLTGHSKLSRDERFVDAMGGALSQVVSTIK